MITNTASAIIAVTTILGVLAIAAVGLRFYARHVQKSSLGPDDWTIIIALVLSTGISVIIDYLVATTTVGDTNFVPTLDQIVLALKINFACENAQIAALAFVKISLLLFYKRIFITPGSKRATNALIAFIAVFNFSIILVNIFDKWPVSDQWNPEALFNVNSAAVLVTFVVISAVCDFLTLILPILTIRHLQMTAHKKLILGTIFSFGSLAVVTSLVRLVYAVEFTRSTPSPIMFFVAPFIYQALWAIIEPPVFIICGCLLSFGPLWSHENGLARYFSSLKSWLLSKTAKRSSPTKHGQAHQTPHGGLHGQSWEALHNHEKKQGTHRANWELHNIDASTEGTGDGHAVRPSNSADSMA